MVRGVSFVVRCVVCDDRGLMFVVCCLLFGICSLVVVACCAMLFTVQCLLFAA